ncbi:MAG: VPLPA-CTERM sorting domain-containing protein [Gammaproteobacteria bacterium]|nr:VPLPA-CTERM sorting domain-containing protein [Gammaproteobacteria bacterium]
MIKLKFLIIIALLLYVNTVRAMTYEVLQGSFSIQGEGFPVDNITIIPGTGTFTEGEYGPSGLDRFIFFGAPNATYFSETSLTGNNMPVPTVDLENLTADFSSFVWVEFGSYPLHQGALAELVAIDDFYRASWSSIITGASFYGYTTEWTMDIRPVPLPAAFWLFVSGLIGMFGVARNKNN